VIQALVPTCKISIGETDGVAVFSDPDRFQQTRVSKNKQNFNER
jgi:hypothetical protein